MQSESIRIKCTEEKLQLHIDGSAINKIIQILQDHNIIILDIEKKMLGTEDRYRQVFGEEGKAI